MLRAKAVPRPAHSAALVTALQISRLLVFVKKAEESVAPKNLCVSSIKPQYRWSIWRWLANVGGQTYSGKPRCLRRRVRKLSFQVPQTVVGAQSSVLS